MDQAKIRSFLREYSDGNYREADHEKFIEWLNTAPMWEIEEVVEEYRRVVEGKPLSGNLPARIIAQIESALNRRDTSVLKAGPVKKKIFTLRRIIRIGAAAAVAVLIAGSLSYWLLNKRYQGNMNGHASASAVQDVQAPQSAKATITLSNGQIVYLDSINNGDLIKQGNVDVVKTARAGVAYKNGYEKVAPGQVKYNTLNNPRGSLVVNITLADGTRVWLNAASSLHYPVSFGGNERKVEITGEAYFEVAKDADRKFLVVANGVLTEVLGTHFNVNAYKEENRTVVTLLEGSVRVEDSGSSEVIQPGQQAVAMHGIHIASHADLESVMAWKNGKFIMKSTDVGEIMRQISRWYNVDVIYETGVPDVKISGEVSRNLNLSQILQVLKYSGIQVKMRGRNVIVLP